METSESTPVFELTQACEQFCKKGSWLAREQQTIEDYELIIRYRAARLVEDEMLTVADLLPKYNAMIARNRAAAGLPPL
jgi:hypothetical protein